MTNQEVDSISRLSWVLDNKIEEGCKEAHNFVKASALGAKYDENEEILVKVDLRTLVRVSWLLEKITGMKHNSGLFDEADENYLTTVATINEASNLMP